MKVEACGICGSDVHGLDGSTGRRQPPLIMGHEASGVVAEAGPAVSGLGSGDRVTFDSTIYRLDDWYTRRGLYNLSDGRRCSASRPASTGGDGAFAEYVAVPQHILYRLPAERELRAGGDGGAGGGGGARRGPDPGRGGGHRRGGRRRDDRPVPRPGAARRRLRARLRRGPRAGEAGARPRSWGPTPRSTRGRRTSRRRWREATGGRGADVAFEAVGIAATVRTAIDAVRRGATVTLVGNLSPRSRSRCRRSSPASCGCRAAARSPASTRPRSR